MRFPVPISSYFPKNQWAGFTNTHDALEKLGASRGKVLQNLILDSAPGMSYLPILPVNLSGCTTTTRLS